MQRLFTQKHPLVVLGLGGLLWLGSMASATASLESGMQAYETGDGVAAAALLKPQAEQGVSEAQLALGYLYYVGQGLQQNHAMAARWFSAAAGQGEPAAMYNLAWLYETGEGVQVNAAKRANWLRKSAEAGYPLAQYELAQNLEFSANPAQRKEAAAWYKKAAAAGLPAAQKNSPAQPLIASAPLNNVKPVAAVRSLPAAVAPKAEAEPKSLMVAKPQPSPRPPVISSAKKAPEQTPPLVVARAPSSQEVQTQAIDRSVPVGKPLPPLPKPKPAAVVKLPPPTPKAKLAKPASKPKPEPSVKAAVAPKPSVTLPTGERALISVSIANMRAAPSTQAATTSRLVRGVEIVIHETFAGWTRVTVVSQPQLNGWVNTSVYRPIQ
jgi:hypothetical protein